MRPLRAMSMLAGLVLVAGCAAGDPAAPEPDAGPEAMVHELALEGDADAQVTLGLMYETGSGVPPDPARAVTWYRKAAAQGDALAQYALGEAYARGVGVRQDYATAAAWLRKAAEQGNASAQFRLGRFYEFGWGVERDYRAAAEWYERAGHARRGQASTPPATDAVVVPTLQPPLPAPPPIAAEAPASEAMPPSPDRVDGLWVHVASLRTLQDALKHWDDLRERHPDLLGPLGVKLSRVDLGATLGEWVRVRTGPLPDMETAKALCRKLQSRDTYCATLGN
ncbi:MAG: SPOR domain-containing protein [Alphaproteobacteria bacterium]